MYAQLRIATRMAASIPSVLFSCRVYITILYPYCIVSTVDLPCVWLCISSLQYCLSGHPTLPCNVLKFKSTTIMLDCGLDTTSVLNFLPLPLVHRWVTDIYIYLWVVYLSLFWIIMINIRFCSFLAQDSPNCLAGCLKMEQSTWKRYKKQPFVCVTVKLYQH